MSAVLNSVCLFVLLGLLQMFDLTRSVAEEFLEVYKGVTADYGRYVPRGIRPGTHRLRSK